MNHNIGLPLDDETKQEEDMVSWESSSYKSDDSMRYYSNSSNILLEGWSKENIPMLTSSYSPGSSVTNSSNILNDNFERINYIRHKHYMLFQKRHNKCILNIEHMNIFDKIRLKYIS